MVKNHVCINPAKIGARSESSSNHFDVTMGSFDGADSSELVGSFLLYDISMGHDNMAKPLVCIEMMV